MGDCRFYEQKYPEIDETVMVMVKRVAEMGAYVQLLEYQNVEGMILLSELSKRRIRSVAKLIRVGRIEVCSVLRVDHEKGYIDLSKKRVSPEDAQKAEEWYAKSKAVHSIMRHVSSQTEVPVQELCQKISWPLYKKYPHALDGLKTMVSEEGALADLNLSKEVFEALLTGVRRRLTPQACKLRGRVEVQCFEYEGVEAVPRALMKGLSVSTPELEVKIKLVAPPQYVLLANCMEREDGLKVLDDAIKLIKEDIEAAGGQFTLRTKPEVVGDNDELGVGDLAGKGDDDDSDSDGSGSESDQDETMGFEMTEDDILKQTGGKKEEKDNEDK
jgi:translation initiation factor 2 subunit 1